MLGLTLVPSVNSIVHTIIVTRKLQSLAATAAGCVMLAVVLVSSFENKTVLNVTVLNCSLFFIYIE